MEYDKDTKVLTASDGKVIVRKADGTVYGKSVALGYCHVIGGVVLKEPHEDTPEDFTEQDEDVVNAENPEFEM